MSDISRYGPAWAAFSCGVILLYWFGVLPPLYCLFCLQFIALLGIYLARHSRLRFLMAAVVFAVGGLAWSSWVSQQALEKQLPSSLEGVELSVSGFLCGIPSIGSYQSVRFSFCVQSWGEVDSELAQRLPQRLRLAWYGKDATLALSHRLNLKVKLKRPHGAVNPGGFRYEAWLFRQGFGATGTVRSLAPAGDGSCLLSCRYHEARNRFAVWLRHTLAGAEHYPLIASLVMGDRGAMTPGHWKVLKATGTNHLVAISGLHLGLVATGTGVLVRWLLLLLPVAWMSPHRTRIVVFTAVGVASLAYALLAGFTVPTRRALVMVGIACWLIFRARLARAWQGWLAALGLVLLLDPLAPLDQGFWLSFGAVAALIVVFSGRLQRPGIVAGLLLAQLAVFAGLWPVLVRFDQLATLAGLPANLVAIPLLSFIVMPVLLPAVFLMVLVPEMASWGVPVLDVVVGGLWNVLEWFSSLPVPRVVLTAFESAAFAMLVLAALVVPISAVRWFGAVVVGIWLSVYGLGQKGEGGNEWVASPEMWVWDVGQGLSVMLRDRDQVLLYDSGPESPDGFSAAESVLIPNLRRLGVRHIDTLVISHGDSDHAGGIPQLLDAFSVGQLISGEPERVRESVGQRLTEHVPAVDACPSGAQLAVGGLVAEFWQSGSHGGRGGHHAVGRQDSNDKSCVLIVRGADAEIILPADLGGQAELELLALLSGRGAEGRRRLLVAGHHGSRTASGQTWVKNLSPEIVIYSAGYRHRFGHPHPEVVRRFRAAGARDFLTANSGALQFRMLPEGLEINEERARAPFWIRPPEPW